MRPHPRIRKTIKWGGLVVVAVIACAWPLSAWRGVQYCGTPGIWIGVGLGRFFYVWLPNEYLKMGESDWHVAAPLGTMRWKFGKSIDPPNFGAVVPLWFLLFLAALPTALAWRLDTLATRRLKLGACPTCSYPRTGLAPSSPCPECGSAAPSA